MKENLSELDRAAAFAVTLNVPVDVGLCGGERPGRLLDDTCHPSGLIGTTMSREHPVAARNGPEAHIAKTTLGEGTMRFVSRLRSIAVDSMVVVALLALGVMIARDFREKTMIVEPIRVPEGLSTRGLTPEVVASRLIDEIQTLQREARTYEKVQNLVSASNRYDVELPGAQLSLRSLIRLIRDHFCPLTSICSSEIHIYGELTREKDRLALRLRVADYRGRAGDPQPTAETDLDGLLRRGALELLRLVNPTGLAAYYYGRHDLGRTRQLVLEALRNLSSEDDAWAFLLWGWVLQDKGATEDAISMYQEALRLDPRLAAALNGWGIALSHKGDLGGALAKYERAMQLDPKYAAPVNNWGRVLQLKGDLDGAIAKFKRATELDPKYASPVNNWGTVLEQKGDLDGAIAKFKRATELDPKNANAVNNWGLCVQQKGDLDGALAKYKRATELDLKNAQAVINWGVILERKGDLDGALAKYKRATELDLKNAQAVINWGVILERKGDLDGALAKYKRATELDRKNAHAVINWGVILQIKGDVDGALAKYKQATELDPEWAEAWNRLGVVLEARGEYGQAAGNYARAIELEPRNANFRRNLGDAYHKSGDARRAIQQYQRAMQLDESYAWLQATIDALSMVE